MSQFPCGYMNNLKTFTIPTAILVLGGVLKLSLNSEVSSW